MQTLKYFLILGMLLSVNQAYAVTARFLTIQDGDEVRNTFQLVLQMRDFPNRPATVTLTVRDKETGNELDTFTDLILSPKKVEMLNEKMGSFPPWREITITYTIRDFDTGNELSTGTITVLPTN